MGFVPLAAARQKAKPTATTATTATETQQPQQQQQQPQEQYATVKSRAAWLAQRCRRRGSSIN